MTVECGRSGGQSGAGCGAPSSGCGGSGGIYLKLYTKNRLRLCSLWRLFFFVYAKQWRMFRTVLWRIQLQRFYWGLWRWRWRRFAHWMPSLTSFIKLYFAIPQGCSPSSSYPTTGGTGCANGQQSQSSGCGSIGGLPFEKCKATCNFSHYSRRRLFSLLSQCQQQSQCWHWMW